MMFGVVTITPRWVGAAVSLLAVCVGHRAMAAEASSDASFFEKRIRPVLVEQCYKCHSAESGKTKGDFAVDSREAIRKPGASGKAGVVPGSPEKSLVVEAIKYGNPDLQMPPKHQLSAEQVKDFEAWIKAGAVDPREAVNVAKGKPPTAESAEAKAFWSFQAVKEPTLPAVKSEAWTKSPVDRFVLAKLEEKGLAPVAPAEKRVLIRRATFDLTGLPPTPEEVGAFVADGTPDAFSKVIDRLLASPAYGERWGRHWLDVARYADTAGESADYPIPQAIKYRDYVIAAFNNDKPYDQFIREQIAGDLIPAKDDAERRERIVATGFVALARRFSVQPDTAMHLTIEDTLDTTGKAVLGLSLSCARCHDHKFDPIPTKDYYSLYGIFESTRFPFPGSENTKYQRDFVPLVPVEQLDPAAREHRKKLGELEAEARRNKKQAKLTQDAAEQRKLKARSKELEKEAEKLASSAPPIDDAYALQEAEQVGDTKIQKRGEPYDKGDAAPRGFLTVLGGQKLPSDCKQSGRLELAGWLTDPANPLTARVMVNRIWQHHFGRGIVKTPNDFGFRGARPSHPELLDYLASQFMKDGWSIKSMHRRIMNSAAYQLSTADDAKNQSIDGTNEMFWRFDRRRLDAESMRDALLAVSGELDRTIPGAHPFPPAKKWQFTQHNPFSAVYDSKNRSVYLMTQRIKRHPYLSLFDGPDPNASTADRITSTTPLQALFMMNDPFVHGQSNAFAARVQKESNGDEVLAIERAFHLAYGRAPTAEESAGAFSYLREFRRAAAGQMKPDDAAKAALASLCRVILSSNEFVFVE